jgi:hypothetical protein
VRDASRDAETTRTAGRAVAGDPERAAQGGLADAVLALQRTAGNRAVTGLLRPPGGAPGPMVQRLSVTASDLDASIGIGSTLGSSSFVAIRKSLSEYEKATKAKKADGDLIQLLDILDAQVTHWLNTHKVSGKESAARRAALQKLEGEMAEERRRLSQAMEHRVYIESLAAGASSEAGVNPAVAGDATKHRFKAAGSGARQAGARALEGYSESIELAKRQHQFLGGDGENIKKYEARMKLVNEKGLTPAEHAAILVYTHEEGNFDFINPGTAGVDPWLAANKGRVAKTTEAARVNYPKLEAWSDVDDKALKEEADLHTRLAVSGMSKLDPYVGLSYRGESRSDAEARTIATVGSTLRQHTLVSTSKKENIAFGFGTKNLGPGKDVAIYWVYEHEGAKGSAADVEPLSAMTGEGEVLLFPDAPFEIKAVAEIAAGRPSPGGPMAAFAAYIQAQFKAGALQGAHKVILILAAPGKERRKKRK